MAERVAELLTRLRSGDESAFDELYAEHFRRVYGYMRVALRDPGEAEDATQEVFERLLGSLDRCAETGAPLAAWVATIARNLVINRLKRRTAICVGDAVNVDALRSQGVPSLEQMLFAGASDEEFLRAISALPEAQRQVLLLRYLLDLGWDEIAAAIGRSVGSAHQLQRRALRTLRPRLAALRAGR